ncbi:MAG TPA: acyl-ACP desaturase [Tepidisphaeraceae bacterium]|nr:acyl-ACP desaturase [Tepidisphaeraceae bacterium]
MSTPDHDAPAAPHPSAPAFPPRNVLDEALYDYFRRSDKMGWSPYDLVDQENIAQICRPERLNEYQRNAVKTVLFVEDHLPGYLSEYLRIMTDPDVNDEQHITNRNTLHFTFRWVAEEDRHAHVLERYLIKSGLVGQKELELDMMRERKQSYIFPYQQLVEGFIYLALQEKATHLYYRALAKDIDEPLLKTVLTKMGADEASHGRFFYDMLIKSHQGDLDALSRKISAVANDFKMPVQNNLINYRRQLLSMMRAAPSYRHPDVFTDMMEAVEKASQSYSRDSLQLITPELGRFIERDNTGGREQEPEQPPPRQ